MIGAHHYTTPPERDHRTWIPLARRGVLARGHTPGRCAACERAQSPEAQAPGLSVVPAAAPPRPPGRARAGRDSTPPEGAPRAARPDESPWAPWPRCALGCGAPQQATRPSANPAHETLSDLCKRHREAARRALGHGRATPATVHAYLAAVIRRGPAPARVVGRESLRAAILLALASMGEGPVTLAALVVRAWQREPERFGLRGFTGLYPDSNKVLVKLSGEGSLPERGWCERPTPGVLRITAKGRRAAAALARTQGGDVPAALTVDGAA